MITIYAEKPDVGTKIAAALDGIRLDSGKEVSFDELEKYEKQIKRMRSEQGYFKINYMDQVTYVTWGYGHMCELKQAQDYDETYKNWRNLPLPYIPEEYQLKLSENVGKQYAIVRECFKKSDLLICATDNDREGDLIFDYVYRYMNCKVPFKRAIFNKQAKDEYIKAFSPNNLVSSNARMPVIQAGRARSIGDFIVGAGPTVAMTLKSCGKDVLSVGRVQTATLNLIVQRELEIKNFVPKDYYVVKGTFQKDGDPVSYVGIHSSKKFEKRQDAEALIKKLSSTDRIGTVSSYKTKEYKKGKPFLYSLDTLQMEANKAYGFSLDYTLKLAQELYEKGYTTYPRTDAVHLTNDMVSEMTGVINMLFAIPEYSQFSTSFSLSASDKHYFDSSKVESHYAIVPTTKDGSGITGDAKKLYHLIALATICMVYPDAVMSKTELETDVHGEIFQTSGTSIVSPGFYKVVGLPKEKLLPKLQEGNLVNSKFDMEAKKTEPPKRYTAATLLNAMLNCGKIIEDEELKQLMADGPGGKPRGLGRPSSRASIVATLENRRYTTTKGKSIFPTDRGMKMIEAFPVDDLKSAVMTAEWEKRLDDIEKGTDSYDSFVNDLEESVRKWTEEIMNTDVNVNESEENYKCPICGKEMREFNWGYACAGTRDESCSFTVGKTIASKKLSDTQIKKLLTTGETGTISGFKSKAGKTFSASLKVDKEKGGISFEFEQPKEVDMLCPVCGSPLRTAPWGYSCSAYKTTGCKFSIGTIAKKKLTDNQIKDLLDGKRVEVKGMTSRAGKKFDAEIYLELNGDEKGKILFNF